MHTATTYALLVVLALGTALPAHADSETFAPAKLDQKAAGASMARIDFSASEWKPQ